MTYREILEFAAKAANMSNWKWLDAKECLCHYNNHGNCFYRDYYGDFIEWNPIVNNADAFALMVKLDIMVYRHPKLGGYMIEASCFSDDYQNILVRQEYKKDEVEEAFRLAIVTCAALIGKKMYNV